MLRIDSEDLSTGLDDNRAGVYLHDSPEEETLGEESKVGYTISRYLMQ